MGAGSYGEPEEGTMESEGIGSLIGMAPPWVDGLFSALGAALVLGAAVMLALAVWYARGVIRDRREERARRKPALFGPHVHKGEGPPDAAQ